MNVNKEPNFGLSLETFTSPILKLSSPHYSSENANLVWSDLFRYLTQCFIWFFLIDNALFPLNPILEGKLDQFSNLKVAWFPFVSTPREQGKKTISLCLLDLIEL